MADKTKKAIQLLEGCDSIQLASINLDGYPRICEMEVLKFNGLSEIYFTTLVNSAKVKQYQSNAKAGVAYSVDYDSVSLVGEVDVVCDMDMKKALWINDHTRRFVENEDGTPKYCILKFKTVAATFFIDGEKETLAF